MPSPRPIQLRSGDPVVMPWIMRPWVDPGVAFGDQVQQWRGGGLSAQLERCPPVVVSKHLAERHGSTIPFIRKLPLIEWPDDLSRARARTRQLLLRAGTADPVVWMACSSRSLFTPVGVAHAGSLGLDGCPGGGGVDSESVADAGDRPSVLVEAYGVTDVSPI
jgi:hypothetical protein